MLRSGKIEDGRGLPDYILVMLKAAFLYKYLIIRTSSQFNINYLEFSELQ